ncbi:MAG TPA: BREX-6 system BrxE protein [Polyangiaceae bacterium]
MSTSAAVRDAAVLDEILALQLTVAWAGESAGDPKRLNWWKSDLVDAEGGGDLFVRLAPKTAAWASLALVRKAAMRVDEAAREKLAQGDRVWTLFHFGFAMDELLSDRIVWHRNHASVPQEILGARFLVGSAWSKQSFETMLSALGKPKLTVTPSGRQLAGVANSPADAARLLAAAMLPLTSDYPLPFVEVES